MAKLLSGSGTLTGLAHSSAGATGGISDGNHLEANANVADNDFLRVDGTEIEGRSASQTLSDIGAAAIGANSDITSITGLTTDLAITHGGTGASSASNACDNLGVGSGDSPTFDSIILDKQNIFHSILAKQHDIGGGFAISFTLVIAIADIVKTDGTSKFKINFQMGSNGGGTNPKFRYTVTGGITVGETEFATAVSGVASGSFDLNIADGTSSDVTLNFGGKRDGGGTLEIYGGSNVLVQEILQ